MCVKNKSKTADGMAGERGVDFKKERKKEGEGEYTPIYLIKEDPGLGEIKELTRILKISESRRGRGLGT